MREVIAQHISLQLTHKGEYIGIREMRKHVSWYMAGYNNASKLRTEINKVETSEELIDCVNKIFNETEHLD